MFITMSPVASSLYTRRGDSGETSLFGARRVAKDTARVEAYGTVDELNALIGLAISSCRREDIATELREIQRMLFVAGADLATEAEAHVKVARISSKDTAAIEAMTDRHLKGLQTLRNFLLPGGIELASRLHVARAVCRRAERRIVTASRAEPVNPELIPFFNRLSSYLFNAARTANLKAGKKEQVWKG